MLSAFSMAVASLPLTVSFTSPAGTPRWHLDAHERVATGHHVGAGSKGRANWIPSAAVPILVAKGEQRHQFHQQLKPTHHPRILVN